MESFPRLVLLSLLLGASLPEQSRAKEFQIAKISRDLITTPQFSYGGAEQQRDPHERWLRVEVQFSATPAYTEEVTFKYTIALGRKLLAGEATHVHVLSGRELYSVMYVPPHALSYFLQNRPANSNSVENIAVQILVKGQVKDAQSLRPGSANWYKTLPTFAGFLLNKNETPFAPLFWGHYEQLKTQTP